MVTTAGFAHRSHPHAFGRTNDGAFIYLQYFGLIHMNDNVQSALAAGEGTEGTDFGDQYFYISPRFETGDERYAWLNRRCSLGKAGFIPGWASSTTCSVLSDTYRRF